MTWLQWFLLLAILMAYVTALSFVMEAYHGRRATEQVGEYDKASA